MSRSRFRRRDSGFHDVAGWLYADVFLALMIVGVGSSVVVRQMVPSVSASPPPSPSLQTQLSCQEFAVPISAQIADGSDELLQNHVTERINREMIGRGIEIYEASPAFVIVLGGFELYEAAGDGDANARQLTSRLRQTVPSLTSVEMRTGGARSVLVEGQRTTVGNNGDYLLVVYLMYAQAEQLCR